MKQWLLVVTLVSSALSNLAWADATLDKNKQEFNAKTQQFMGALVQSIAKMDKNFATLSKSETTLQGYLKNNPTPQERQCINAMLTRATGTKNLIAGMRQQLVSAQKQMPSIKSAALKAKSTTELNQTADKANALVQGLNTTGDKNSQMAEKWTATVDKVCASLQ